MAIEKEINYADLIKRIRKAKDLTQQELADLTAVSQGYINGLELGNTQKPSIEFVRKLVLTLKVNPYVFIYEDEDALFIQPVSDEVKALQMKVEKYEKHIEAMLEIMVGKKPGNKKAVSKVLTVGR